MNSLPYYFLLIFFFKIFPYCFFYLMLKCFYYQNNRRLYAAFLGLYCVFRIAGSCYLPDFEYDNLLMGRIKSYNERLYIHNKTFEPQ